MFPQDREGSHIFRSVSDRDEDPCPTRSTIPPIITFENVISFLVHLLSNTLVSFWEKLDFFPL